MKVSHSVTNTRALESTESSTEETPLADTRHGTVKTRSARRIADDGVPVTAEGTQLINLPALTEMRRDRTDATHEMLDADPTMAQGAVGRKSLARDRRRNAQRDQTRRTELLRTGTIQALKGHKTVLCTQS